jgi:hypothetical protein
MKAEYATPATKPMKIILSIICHYLPHLLVVVGWVMRLGWATIEAEGVRLMFVDFCMG